MDIGILQISDLVLCYNQSALPLKLLIIKFNFKQTSEKIEDKR